LTADFLLSYLFQYLDAYEEKIMSPDPDVNRASVSEIINDDDEFGLPSDLKTPVVKKRKKKVQSTPEYDFNSPLNSPFAEATPYVHFSDTQKKKLKDLNKIQLVERAKTIYGIQYEKPPQKKDIISDMESAYNNNFRPDENKKIEYEFIDTTEKNLEKLFAKPKKKSDNEKEQSGKGLTTIHKPFGNYRINIPKLKGNILHLSFPCGSPVRKVKPRYISNNFKEFLEYFIETQKFNENLYNQLSDAEKKHFYDCVKESGLYKTKDIKVNNPFKEQEMKEMNRFDILLGEIEAGNDNPKMVRELKTLLIKLTKAGKISRKESMETLEELTTLGL
jgi:hypothetical protein